MSKTIEFIYDEKKYSLEVIRYVFYTLSDRFWVIINRTGNKIKVSMEPISEKNIDVKKIKKEIEEEFKNESIRQKIWNENKDLREYLIQKAITYTPPTPKSSDEGLTPEEEKELEKLIKEVEEEISKEMKKEKKNDIKKTWEEKYEKK